MAATARQILLNTAKNVAPPLGKIGNGKDRAPAPVKETMTRKPRQKPSPAELNSMLRTHVSFEINRFRVAAAQWGKCTYGVPVDAMVRESCLIHFRLLLDFFYPRASATGSKFEDVFASDYLPELDLLTLEFRELLAEPSWLQGYRDQLDWRLAHLTLKRIRFERRPAWEPRAQFAHVEHLITQFLAALPCEMRALFDPNLQ